MGLEIVNKLEDNQNEVFVGLRTSETRVDYLKVQHLQLDVTKDFSDLEGLPEIVHGLVYCPGTIILKPFQRLTISDFRRDLEINLLGAVKVIQGCLKKLKKSPTGASVVLFSTVAVKVGMPFHASVASAKLAVEGLTRSPAAEFAPALGSMPLHLPPPTRHWPRRCYQLKRGRKRLRSVIHSSGLALRRKSPVLRNIF